MKHRISLIQGMLGITLFVISGNSFSDWKLADYISPPARDAMDVQTVFPMSVMAMSQSTFSTTVTTNETEVTEEIRALVRALHHDPLEMYAYVKNHIEYVPTYGVYVGAAGCLKAMKGNDFDQCALLAALLRESGYECHFRNADVIYNRSDVVKWLPTTEDDADSVHVNCGGYSGYITGVPSKMFANRTWLVAQIDGNEVEFDPSMKMHTTDSAIDLASAAGYDLATLRTTASSNAVVTGDSVKNMNKAALDELLSEYSANVTEYLKTHHSGDGVDEIYGLRKIISASISSYPTALPYSEYIYPSTVTNWMHIPTNNFISYRIQHEGIDETFLGSELAGKRLSIMYDSSNGYRPVLYLNGSVYATGNSTSAGQAYDLVVNVAVPTHPNSPGTFDDGATQSIKSGGEYVLVQDGNSASPKVLSDANNNLSDALNAGLPDTNEAVVCGAIEQAAWMYRMQDFGLTKILSKECGVAGYTMYLMGVCGQDEGMYIDLPIGYSSACSWDTNKRNKYFTIKSLMGSALEHGVFEQNQHEESVSTIRLLSLSDANGKKTLLANSNTWSSVESQLVGYDSGFKASLGAAAMAGTTFVLPESPNITYNEWSGIGYISLNRQANWQSMAMEIQGGSNGGRSSNKKGFWATLASWTTGVYDFFTYDIWHVFSWDPVDMHTGNYVLDTTDIKIGNAPAPLGLEFTRSYSNGKKRNETPLGYGWTHSQEIDVTELTRTEPAQGGRSPEDAVSQMVYAMIASDLMEGTPDVLDWTIAVYASDWAMKQMTVNAAIVQIGKNSMEFIRQPDDSYTAPPGMTQSLVKTNDVFIFKERHGNAYVFNADNDIASISNLDGKMMLFTYSGGKLANVKDAYNRTLTLGYTGDRLTSVTDGSRTVSYLHDSSGNLTNVNDATSYDWGIAYDSDHQIKSLTDPEGIVTIQNNYNSLGQVTNQISATQNDWNYYTTGFQASEEDPYGNLTTYYFDERGRNLGMLDAISNRTENIYDAQGRLSAQVSAAGVTNIFKYDGNHNLLVQTNALGTAVEVAVHYGYDAQNHLRFVTNAVGSLEQTVTEYTYTSEHKIDAITEAKGTTVQRITDLDYNGNGLLDKRTEGNGARVTDYTYDTYGNPDIVSSTDVGALDYKFDSLGNMEEVKVNGITTKFVYDNRRLLKDIYYAYGIAEQKSEHRTYWDNGLLKTATDRKNKETQYFWTPAYKQSGIILPDTGSVTNLYDASDRLVMARDAEELWTTNTLNGIGQSIAVQSSGVSMTNQFDAIGNITNSVIDPASLHLETSLVYDPGNRLKERHLPIGHEEYQLDILGRTTNRLDAATKEWKSEFDELSQLRKSRRPSNKFDEYKYNALGHRVEFRNAEGKPIFFGMDAQGRVTSITNAINKSTSFDYDDAGNLSRRVAADLSVTDYGYDQLNQLVAITNDSVVVAAFDHDGNGNMVSIDNTVTSVALGYDSMNRLQTSTQTVASVDFVVGNQFDLNGNRTNIVYPGGLNVSFEYGAGNRVEGVTTKYGGVTKTASFGYDGASRMTNIVYPNTVVSFFEYNGNGQVTSIKHGGFVDRGMHRNILGFKYLETINAGIKPTVLESVRRIKTHNDADQLVSERIQQNVTNWTDVAYSYDNNGCLTNILSEAQGSTGFSYDYDNRLLSAGAIEYLYGAAGARVCRIDGATTNYFVIDYSDRLKRPLAEANASGAITRYYVWSGHRLLCHIDTVAGGGDPGGTTRYYHADELGSTLALTDEFGNVTDEFAYMPYGHATHTPHAGSADTPFQWLGGYGVYYDTDVGLHLTLHRAYSSDLKRFIQPDPLGIDGGVNVYMWANMNPLAFIDPYGLEAWTNPDSSYNSGGGNQEGGANSGWLSRSVNYVQGALESVGNAVWSGVSYTGQAVWSGVSYVGDSFGRVANQLSDFQWHGLWGGPNWTAGKSKPERSLTKQDRKIGETDARDGAYKQHDIDIFDAQNHSPFHDMRLGWNLLQVPPWQPSFWMTDRGAPIPAYVESLLWFTGLPGVVQ